METKVNKDSSDELFDLFKGIVILGKKNDESLFYIQVKRIFLEDLILKK